MDITRKAIREEPTDRRSAARDGHQRAHPQALREPPLNAPAPPERRNKTRKSFAKAPAEDDEVLEDDAPEVDSPESNEPILSDDNAEE